MGHGGPAGRSAASKQKSASYDDDDTEFTQATRTSKQTNTSVYQVLQVSMSFAPMSTMQVLLVNARFALGLKGIPGAAGKHHACSTEQ